jgi:hypothetical protein
VTWPSLPGSQVTQREPACLPPGQRKLLRTSQCTLHMSHTQSGAALHLIHALAKPAQHIWTSSDIKLCSA